MREMRDSGNMWIGATPETWKMIPLKYLASYNDEVLSENTDDEFEFDYIEIGSVQYGRGIIYTEHMKFKNAPSRARRIVRKDDIIVSTVRTYLKAVATIPACNNSLIASTGFIVIRPHKVLPRFMNYALLSESFISLVESHSTGISYPAINSVDVVKFKIPVPCRSEQERIAAFLDAECAEIDAVLEKTRASIEEYKKLKQAVITQAVTKGIRGDRPMKDSGIEWIGEISQDFEIVKLKWLCDVLDQFRSPVTADKRNQNADVLYDYYGASGAIDKIDGYTIDDHVMLIGEDGANLRMRNLPIMYEINGKAWVNNHAHILKPKAGVDFYFIFYALEALDLNYYITGSAQPKLSQDNLRNIWVPITALTEQKRIAAYISDVCAKLDCLIARKQQYLIEIENYKKSLIYEYVTGKKEVKTNVLAD